MEIQSEADLAKRKEFIAEMQRFIESECTEIGELLDHLNWTPDHILKRKLLTQCPYDPGHWVPESSLKQHTTLCCLKKQGLSAEDVEAELRNDDVFYEKSNVVGKVKLDEGLLNRILWNHAMEHGQVHEGHHAMPVGSVDWVVKLSPQERLAVYQHCAETLKAQGRMANVERDDDLTTDWEKIVKKGMLGQGGEKPKSKLELYAMLRDQKRRRQSYRAKNVHVTKKSYTEIIREVIQNQLEIFMPSAEQKERQEEDHDENKTFDRDASRSSQASAPSSSRHRSQSPKRQRNTSHFSDRRQKRSHREDQAPRRSRSRSRFISRSRSRSRSPRKRDRSSRREHEGSVSGKDGESEGRRRETPERSSEPLSLRQGEEFEEGQVESESDSSPHHYHHHRSSRTKKKSSRHKKHKHKKHRSRS